MPSTDPRFTKSPFCHGLLEAWSVMRPDILPVDLMRFTIVPPDTAPLHAPGNSHELAISPDGTQVVYQSGQGGLTQLTLRPIDQLVEVPVRGTDGASAPVVSPDGEWVAFVQAGNRILLKVSIFGGPPVRVTEAQAGEPTTGSSLERWVRACFVFREAGGNPRS